MSGIRGSIEEVPLGDGRIAMLASTGRRRLARLLDMVVLALPMWMYVGSVFAHVASSLAYSFDGFLGASRDPDLVVTPLLSPSGWVGLLVLVLYEPVMVALWGATVGKLAVGIRVVSVFDGAGASAGSSWLRAALPAAVGVATLGAGWFVVMFVLNFSLTSDRYMQGWHDTFAGTVVITKATALSPRPECPAMPASVSGREGVPIPVAGLGARLRAATLDVVAAAPLAALGGCQVQTAALDYNHCCAVERLSTAEQIRLSAAQWLPMVAVLSVIVVLWGLVSVARRGATPGMRGAGVKAARFDDGGPVGLSAALLRRAVPGVPLLVGVVAFVWALWSGTEGNPGVWLAVVSLTVWALVHASVLWDPHRRGWADKAAGTVVVDANERPTPPLAIPRRATRGLLTGWLPPSGPSDR